MLSHVFDVTALCFYRWKGGLLHQDLESSLEGLRRIGVVEAFPIPQERSRLRLLRDHLGSVVSRRPYTVPSYESKAFRDRMGELLDAESFDLVHADSLDLSGYFAELRSRELPIVCVHHDVQSLLLQRRARHETMPVKRSYVRLQARLMEREERRWCPRVRLNIMVSDTDRIAMSRVAPGAGYAVVPNGVDIEYFRPSPDGASCDGVVFVGGTTWFPNLDALRYFRGEILPHMRARDVKQPVTWVGRASPDEMAEFGSDGDLRLTGYVEDIRPYVQAAACYVVPLRVGGGTRIKILDAWAMGKAVVSTSIGCEGLDARDGENILIRDREDDFAEAVARVLSDSKLRRRLGRRGRETVERRYSWEAIGAAMNDRYRSLLS